MQSARLTQSGIFTTSKKRDVVSNDKLMHTMQFNGAYRLLLYSTTRKPEKSPFQVPSRGIQYARRMVWTVRMAFIF